VAPAGSASRKRFSRVAPPWFRFVSLIGKRAFVASTSSESGFAVGYASGKVRRRTGFMGSRLAIVVVMLARSANAASFSWSAPESCPTEASVRARLERDFGADFDASSGVTFEAVVGEPSGAFELRLKVRGRDGTVQERRIRATTCDELVDALVAAMALARQALKSPESTAEPPLAAAKPEPDPEPRPSTPSTAKRAAPTADAGAELVPNVALGALLDVGALPSVAFGVEALAGLELRSLDVMLLGALTTPQHSTFDGGAAEFDLAFGGASVCYSPERSTWELAGCLTGEVGRIRGIGVNVENPREGSSLWLALVPAARLRLRPSPRRWGLFVQVGAVVPLARTPFELTEVGIVHEPAPVGLRSVAGFELGFH
jgi:hypothetical protein